MTELKAATVATRARYYVKNQPPAELGTSKKIGGNGSINLGLIGGLKPLKQMGTDIKNTAAKAATPATERTSATRRLG